MKNAFVIVTLSGLLSACAVAPQQQPENVAAALPAQIEAPAPLEALAEAPELDPTLPKVKLTKEMLYRLLKAEFDIRNGQWQGAYMTLLGAAQQTRDPRLARRAADVALQARQSDEALVAVRLWRELAPASEDADQYFLGLAMLADTPAEAEPIFARRLADATPATRPMAMHQAQQYLSRARNKAAGNAMLERLLAPYSATFEARVLLAQTAHARGDAVAAYSLARSALALKPDSELGVLTLAQATPEGPQQEELLGDFLVRNPDAREVRAALARLLVTQKKYPEARQQFAALLKDQPNNTGTLYALGLTSMQLNDFAAAEHYFTRFIAAQEANPGDEREPGKVLMILGQLAEERGDLKAALGWLDKVDAGEEGNYLAAQIKRAQLVAKQGDLPRARSMLASLRGGQPQVQLQVLLAEGQILREAGQLEQAYQLLGDGARRFPDNPDLLYEYAMLAEKTNRLDVMERSLRSVMAQAPDNHHAYNALGYSLAERNVRLPEALELIGKALAMAPDDPFILDSMGWVQYRLGKLDEAEVHLRRAYALRNDVDIAAHLGEVLWHKGQKDAAHKLWREAQARDPRNDTLKSTLARLHPGL